MDEITITKPGGPGRSLDVSFQQTRHQYDAEPNLRLYCTLNPNGHTLQIRATAPLESETREYKQPRNLIASINLTIDDLRAIAEYVKHYDQTAKEWGIL